jgi:hypothetical protein
MHRNGEDALALVLCLIQRCPNDREGVLGRSLEHVHRLVGLYPFSICTVIWIILDQNLRHFDPLRPERVAFCTRANLFVEPRARLRFSPFERLCCENGKDAVMLCQTVFATGFFGEEGFFVSSEG